MPGELVRRALNLMAQDSPDGACGCGFQMESLIYLFGLEDVFTLLNFCFSIFFGFGLGIWKDVGSNSFLINYNLLIINFLVRTQDFVHFSLVCMFT